MYLKSMLTLVVSVCLMGASFANSEVPYPASYQPLTSEDVAIVGATIMPADKREIANGTVIPT